MAGAARCSPPAARQSVQSVVSFSSKELHLMPAALEITHQFDAARAAGRPPFKVRDVALATLGRSEIRLAEHEMPGLMASVNSTAPPSPLPERASWVRCT